MNATLKLIGITGAILFGLLFSITFLSPDKVETSAKSFVKSQIEREVRAKQKSISNSTTVEAALTIANRLGVKKKQIQSHIENNLPEKIASIISLMCGYNCEKKKALTHSITVGYIEKIKKLQIAGDTLNNIVRGKYLKIMGNLEFDLRIFLGSNLALFLVLLASSFAKPKAMTHLFLPGILLATATLLSSFLYIYGQNWFYTILYNDYMGFGYLAYIATIFGFLLDIILNSAKITAKIINSLANAIGSSFSVIPC